MKDPTHSPFPASEDDAAQCFTVTDEVPNSPEWLDRLFAALQMNKGTFIDKQFQHLKELIGENLNVFALQDLELGYINLVENKVDIGDHPPIK